MRKGVNRCNLCYHRLVNKLVVIKCIYCKKDFEFPEESKQKWKKNCNNCWIKHKKIYDCQTCDNTFYKLEHETWRKFCLQCHEKNK